MAGNRAAIVLAAGHGHRFGGDKQLARLPCGNLLLEQTIGRVLDATDHVLLVTRPDLTAALSDALPDIIAQTRVVECPESALGMGHSLARGVQALHTDIEACLICLGDMPWVRTSTYRRLLSALHSQSILIPACDGGTGHPVGFGRRFFTSLEQCHGDRGARDVIRQHPEACMTLAVDDRGILRDVDTRADLLQHGGN